MVSCSWKSEAKDTWVQALRRATLPNRFGFSFMFSTAVVVGRND